MYIRASHRARAASDVVEVMREAMFATLVSAAPAGLMASHLPFVVRPERGEHGTLFAHMARANPHAEVLGRGEELVAFTGPHAYISPSWYADRATAPTWDYVAVHCDGPAIVHSAADAERNIGRLLRVVEAGHKEPWRMDELGREDVERMVANVVSFEIPLTRIEGKFKLNQGERPERTRAAVEELERRGDSALAAWMRRYNDCRKDGDASSDAGPAT